MRSHLKEKVRITCTFVTPVLITNLHVSSRANTAQEHSSKRVCSDLNIIEPVPKENATDNVQLPKVERLKVKVSSIDSRPFGKHYLYNKLLKQV